MAPFSETRLDLGIVYGSTSTYRFNTTILSNSAGQEQRNSNWAQPLSSYQIGNKSLDRAELDTLIQFHKSRKGALEGFRFKDWIDYRATAQPIGIGNGIINQYQLIKSYSIGAFTTHRPITKPVSLTAKIYLNGVATTAYSLNPVNGLLTFSTPPNNGVIISADFEFDIPVRFETDEIAYRFEAYETNDRVIYSLDSLNLVEIRIPPAKNVPPNPSISDLGVVLDLGYDYGTLGGNQYKTLITAVAGGNERRDAQRTVPLGRWNVGDRTLNQTELDYLISFFRIAKGSAAQWRYKDWAQNLEIVSRFETDSLSLQYDAIDLDRNDAIYNLSGLPVVEASAIASVQYVLFPQIPIATPSPCRIQNFEYDITFSDTTFSLSNYEIYHFTADTGGTYNFSQKPTGGNPETFMETSITINQMNSGAHSFSFAFAHKKDAIWTPSQGQALYFNYSEDFKFINAIGEGLAPGPSGQVCYFAALQNNKIYVPGYFLTLLSKNWSHFGQRYELSDFRQIGILTGANTGNLIWPLGTETLDFSLSGSQIKFGWARSQDQQIASNGAYTRIAGIDNWNVVLRVRAL
jgi:uncharacterized protein (TIGR02217 family)